MGTIMFFVFFFAAVLVQESSRPLAILFVIFAFLLIFAPWKKAAIVGGAAYGVRHSRSVNRKLDKVLEQQSKADRH